MAKQNKILFANNPGMIFVLTYIILMATTAGVIYLANMWFPQYVVLGTMSMTPMWAICLTASKLALLGTFALPFLTEFELHRKKELSSTEMMIAYLVINFFAVWGVTRFSEIYGMGVTSWVVVLALAAALDIVQGIAMVMFEKVRKGN